MKYKIYRLNSTSQYDSGVVMSVILDDDFQYVEFDTMEEALTEILSRGNSYVNYTILPYIYLNN